MTRTFTAYNDKDESVEIEVRQGPVRNTFDNSHQRTEYFLVEGNISLTLGEDGEGPYLYKKDTGERYFSDEL